MKYEVYHGTNQEIDSFKHGVDNKGLTSQYGFWFTDSIEEAHQYGKNSAQRMHKNQEIHDATVEKYLADIKNAERSRNWNLAEELTEKMEEFDGTDDSSYYIYTVNVTLDNPLSVGGSIGGEQETIIKSAIDKGYDSVVFNDISDSPYGMDDTTRQIVVFDNSNIKIVNVDEFDGESINESLRGFVKNLTRDDNAPLIESILNGFDVIFESENNAVVGGKADDNKVLIESIMKQHYR